MFASRNLQRRCLRSISSLLQSNLSKNIRFLPDGSSGIVSSKPGGGDCLSFPSIPPARGFSGRPRPRPRSNSRVTSLRSKVEIRMQRESGKAVREIRRAKRLKRKLMSDEEKLIDSIRKAKKKVALLLQKLKKFKLPELPPPLHDPELFTPEQLQAYKKIGYKNSNYLPVGVRGVFGGVIQNLHLHWKFHETVQVCCEHYPKEKINEMATMLARLSGGIVINIHNVNTIIMFRGRNYRQPKVLIPVNTLTKRKALFKARYEQALESQRLNIKKYEQKLRQLGVNPEDPVAMASVQKVASTFFNAIDKKEGSPYVYQGDKKLVPEQCSNLEQLEPVDDSDQEELDSFIAEIEDAADKEWAREEAAEAEEARRFKYMRKEDFDARSRRFERHGYDSFDSESGGKRGLENSRGKQRTNCIDDADTILEEDDEKYSNDFPDVSDHESDVDGSDEASNEFKLLKTVRGRQDMIGRVNSKQRFRRIPEANFRKDIAEGYSESENMFSDLDSAMFESDVEEERDSKGSRTKIANYISGSCEEDEDIHHMKIKQVIDTDDSEAEVEFNVSGVRNGKQENIGRANGNKNFKRNPEANFWGKMAEEDSELEDISSGSEIANEEWDNEDNPEAKRFYLSSGEEDCRLKKYEKSDFTQKKKTRKQMDEAWDSD